jgi:hypothetical protein
MACAVGLQLGRPRALWEAVNLLTPSPSTCWSCGRAVDPDDRYCRGCGQGQGAFVAWYYRPVWIVLLSLTVLGPFALPLVWRTPRLSRGGKWVTSAALILVFAWVGWRFVVDMRHVLEQLDGSDELLAL